MGIGLILLVVIAVAVAVLILFTGPRPTKKMQRVIEDVMRSEVTELIHGNTGYVQSQGTRIWYESIAPKGMAKGAVLLFMGISMDALGWPQGFIDRLTAAGYRVIRFDYRGTGLSDWKSKPYALVDLATDGVAILDALNIRQTHLIGVSMGGMVVQEFAIHYPERTLSVAILMSSGNIIDPHLPAIPSRVGRALLKNSFRYGLIATESNMIRMNVTARMILRGTATYDIDVNGIAMRTLYNLRRRRGYNRFAYRQHRDALIRSGARYAGLKSVEHPALIIHGVNDPLIPVAHSRKLAEILPRATAKYFENMGHDLPFVLFDALTAELISNFEKSPTVGGDQQIAQMDAEL